MKRKGKFVQELLGIKSFTNNGLKVGKEELLFFNIQPINISVLSQENVERKIYSLMLAISVMPYLEIVCTDSSECFDTNKNYLKERIEKEQNKKVKELLSQDIEFLDEMQTEISTSRQFVIMARCKNMKGEQVLKFANDIEKKLCDEGFQVTRMKKQEIKRFLANYFEASLNGDRIPDYDGEQYVSEVTG